MKKYIPIEAQITAKLERREKFKILWARVSKMPELERVQMSNRLGIVTCEGRQLSICNQIMLALQLPGVSIVGGFRQWIKNGRAVRKGEHGAMIWVPTGNPKKIESVGVPAGVPMETAEVHFIIGTVFDIGQTDAINARTDAVIEVETVTHVAPLELPAPMPEFVSDWKTAVVAGPMKRATVTPQLEPMRGMSPLGFNPQPQLFNA